MVVTRENASFLHDTSTVCLQPHPCSFETSRTDCSEKRLRFLSVVDTWVALVWVWVCIPRCVVLQQRRMSRSARTASCMLCCSSCLSLRYILFCLSIVLQQVSSCSPFTAFVIQWRNLWRDTVASEDQTFVFLFRKRASKRNKMTNSRVACESGGKFQIMRLP